MSVENKSNSGSRRNFLRASIYGAGYAVRPGIAAPRADPVDNQVRAEMAKRRIPGLAFAVVRSGKLLKMGAHGLASVELNAPVGRETAFPLASLTKVFTASAIMSLVEKGRFSLDDSVTTIVPALPPSCATVTIRHCLSHTSGLADALDPSGNALFSTRRDLLRQLSETQAQKPGERASYNQTGYLLLGMVIEESTATTAEEFITSRLLRPLAMSSSRYGDSRDVVAGRTSSYSAFEPSDDRHTFRAQNGAPVIAKNRTYVAAPAVLPQLFYTAAGLNSSVADLVRWELAFSTGRVLNGATVRQMAEPVKLNNGQNATFGLGWNCSQINGHRVMQFGGGGRTWYLRLPEDDLAVIVLTNLQGAAPHSLAMNIALHYAKHYSSRAV